MTSLAEYLNESEKAASNLSAMEPFIRELSECIFQRIEKGGTVYWAGNGGSAGDSQHLACELVSKFAITRNPIRSVALTTNTSLLTAISNDYGYEHVFTRQVEAFITANDVFIGISTSGESVSVVNAAILSKKKGALVVALTNEMKNSLGNVADFTYNAPSVVTGVVQQCHITVGQAICLELERLIIGN